MSQPSDQINHSAALEYWSSVSATDDGVLGGYPQVSRADLQGSAAFLAKLRRRKTTSKIARPNQTTTLPSPPAPLRRAVDCGAGIGRVTKGFLSKIAEVVDIVEPVTKLTDVISQSSDFASLREKGTIGTIYNTGLQDFAPPPDTRYDLIWTQWCIGQITDRQFVMYLERMKSYLSPGGWLVVKENMSTDERGEDIFDETDNSVTRSDGKFRELFGRAGWGVVGTEVQKGMPGELFPVRMYAVVPE